MPVRGHTLSSLTTKDDLLKLRSRQAVLRFARIYREQAGLPEETINNLERLCQRNELDLDGLAASVFNLVVTPIQALLRISQAKDSFVSVAVKFRNRDTLRASALRGALARKGYHATMQTAEQEVVVEIRCTTENCAAMATELAKLLKQTRVQ